jgi:DNA-3-methyladenine glycosylase II
MKILSQRRRAPDAAAFRVLASDEDIAAGVKALRRKCPAIRRIHDAHGDPPLRRHESGFKGLARAIVGQQLSIASAEAIWRRTAAAVEPFDAPSLLAAPGDALRRAGLSGGKIATLRAAARAVACDLDLAALAGEHEDAVREKLTAIHGVGPWTADIYLMFCMGRADAWAPGDLGLALGAQSAFGLAARPSKDELAALAERWRPWRAVAARFLWVHYAAQKRYSACPRHSWPRAL